MTAVNLPQKKPLVDWSNGGDVRIDEGYFLFESENVKCPRCGYENPPDRSYCRSCRAYLGPAQQGHIISSMSTGESASDIAMRRDRRGTLIIATLGSVAGLFGVFFYTLGLIIILFISTESLLIWSALLIGLIMILFGAPLARLEINASDRGFGRTFDRAIAPVGFTELFIGVIGCIYAIYLTFVNTGSLIPTADWFLSDPIGSSVRDIILTSIFGGVVFGFFMIELSKLNESQ
jgi:hypothetical protein